MEGSAAIDVDVAQRIRGAHPRILLAATLRWPLAARLAIAFRSLECPVEAWCPVGHPLEKTLAVGRIHPGGVLAPQRTLHAAIRASAPDFVIPCDDGAALHLARLYQRSEADASMAAVRRLIERSLGTPGSCALATTRGKLMRLAEAAGVRIPAAASLTAPGDLERWAARHGFPAVLKVDGSWGGLGVSVVGDLAQARKALHGATHPPAYRALLHLILRRDPSHLWGWLAAARPGMTVQAYIAGRPANCAVACWRGEVLAGISVVALQTQSAAGPASVVRIIENAEMSETARRLVRALGLSGFCGLDFVIEAATGAAYLIEINPRATPISHLALGAGHDLPAALHARLQGEPVGAARAPIGARPGCGDVIVMFPGEWQRNPLSPYLRSGFHDVPWAESGLVRECVALPWEERGIAARIRARLNPKRAAGAAELSRPAAPPFQ